MSHVADGIDVDEQTHSGDEQEPNARERVEQEADLGLEVRGEAVFGGVGQVARAGAEPGEHHYFERLAAGVGVGVLVDGTAGEDEGESNRSDANGADGALLQLAAEEKHKDRAESGEKRDEIDVVEEKHISRRVVRRWRNRRSSVVGPRQNS